MAVDTEDLLNGLLIPTDCSRHGLTNTIKATLVARIWQVQEYDDARECLLHLVSTNESALLRQPESQ